MVKTPSPTLQISMQHTSFVYILETLGQLTGDGYDEFLRQSRTRVLRHGCGLHQSVDTTTACIFADDPEFVVYRPSLFDDVDVRPCLAVS